MTYFSPPECLPTTHFCRGGQPTNQDGVQQTKSDWIQDAPPRPSASQERIHFFCCLDRPAHPQGRDRIDQEFRLHNSQASKMRSRSNAKPPSLWRSCSRASRPLFPLLRPRVARVPLASSSVRTTTTITATSGVRTAGYNSRPWPNHPSRKERRPQIRFGTLQSRHILYEGGMRVHNSIFVAMIACAHDHTFSHSFAPHIIIIITIHQQTHTETLP